MDDNQLKTDDSDSPGNPYSERAELALLAFEKRLERGEFDYLFKNPKWHMKRKSARV